MISGFVYRIDRRYRRLKRIADLAIAVLVIPFASPVLLAAAAAIKLEDGGPIFFVQKRVGQYGKLFDLYKLRTMRVEACGDAVSPTQKGDRRITRVGTILRKLSIDELPQLYNVLRGDLAVVGPRPEMPFIVRDYLPWQQLRHIVVPGITGLWQVECRSTIPLHRPEATSLDLRYIEKASPLTDSLILFKTARAIMWPNGAY
jgi:lipopolysaccharide/colanic/teichoic acid biosynthesis glycosyltransferase